MSDPDFDVNSSNDTNHTDISVPDAVPVPLPDPGLPYPIPDPGSVIPGPVLPPITEPINVTPSQDSSPGGQYLHVIPNPIVPVYIVNNDPTPDPPDDDEPPP